MSKDVTQWNDHTFYSLVDEYCVLAIISHERHVLKKRLAPEILKRERLAFERTRYANTNG